MRAFQRKPSRRGAVTVEMAVVTPVVFTLIMGMVIGAIGVFHFQQMATLAREGARWASMRGPGWQDRNNQSAPSGNDVFTNAMQPLAGSLDLDQLQYTVTWNASKSVVTVNVQYNWVPPAFWGAVRMKSTSVALVSP